MTIAVAVTKIATLVKLIVNSEEIDASREEQTHWLGSQSETV